MCVFSPRYDSTKLRRMTSNEIARTRVVGGSGNLVGDHGFQGRWLLASIQGSCLKNQSICAIHVWHYRKYSASSHIGRTKHTGRESRYDYARRALSELVGLHRLDCFGRGGAESWCISPGGE